MARYLEASGCLHALGNLLTLVLREGEKRNDRLELLSVFLNINRVEAPQVLEVFLPAYQRIVGGEYWDRAEQLYVQRDPLRWKVSYRGRLDGSGTSGESNQIEEVVRSIAKTPGANTLTFAFYRPADHRRARAIPASMPCPVAGDFKYREGRLHLNVLFRTHDVLRLGFPDLYFMRLLQREVLGRLHETGPTRFAKARLGELNLLLSRAFVLMRHRRLAEDLLRQVEQALTSEESNHGRSQS